MTGIIETTKGAKMAFRKEDGVWLLWRIHSDFTRGECHKSKSLPKGVVETFNIERPPRTVGFVPILTSY